MITKVTIVLQTRFSDEEEAEEILEGLLEGLVKSSDNLVVGYELGDTKEEDVDTSDAFERVKFDPDSDDELPF